jgi:hypothetical protein
VITESFHLSGIVTIFAAGVTLAHYAWYSLTHSAQVTTKVTLSSMSDIAEGFAFAYVGLSLWGFTKESFHISFSVFMLATVFVSRCVTIFGLCYVLTPFSSEFALPLNEKIGFVFGGIVRGCLCWAQILQLQGEDANVLITTTLLIVMVTIVGCGFLLPAILPKLIPVNNNALSGSTRRNLFRASAGNNSLFQENDQADVPNEQSALTINNQTINNNTQNFTFYMNQTKNNASTGNVSILSDNEPQTTPRTHIKHKQEFSHPHNAFYSLCYVLWVRFDENVMKPMFGGSHNVNESSLRSEILKRTSHMSICYMITHYTEVQQIFENDEYLGVLYGELMGTAYTDSIEDAGAGFHSQEKCVQSFDEEFMESLVLDDEYFDLSGPQSRLSSASTVSHRNRGISPRYSQAVSPINLFTGGKSVSTPKRRGNTDLLKTQVLTNSVKQSVQRGGQADNIGGNARLGPSVAFDDDDLSYDNLAESLFPEEENDATNRSMGQRLNNCNTCQRYTVGGQNGGHGRDSVGDYFEQQLQGAITYYQSSSPIPHVHEV